MIEAQMSERDYALGHFYENSRHYYAARYYYNEVVKQYPQSKFADLAKARIEGIKDKPPDSKNEIEWLASKFGRSIPTPPGMQTPPNTPAAPGTPQDPTIFAGTPPQGVPQQQPPGSPTWRANPQDQR